MLTINTKNDRPKEIWVDKRTAFAGEFEKLCKAEAIRFYSEISETKATLAEPTMRSLEFIPYLHMEDYGFRYFHKLTPFIETLNARKNAWYFCYRRMLKIPTFCPFCTETHYEDIDHPSFKLETKFDSRRETHPSGRVISHSLHWKFLG